MHSNPLSVSIPCTATINLSLLGDSLPEGAPSLMAIDPSPSKPGTLVTAIGTNLSSGDVAGVFLSDARFDWKADIEKQSANVLCFRIPEFARKGPQRILLLSARNRRLVGQSVTLTVE